MEVCGDDDLFSLSLCMLIYTLFPNFFFSLKKKEEKKMLVSGLVW